MKQYGLLGHKISYSLSPAMHNAAFKKFGIDAEYKFYDMPKGKIKAFFNGLLRSNISGLNVTIPYKQQAYKFLTTFGIIDKEAEMLGAINTINIKHKTLYGFNTDAEGFIKALKAGLDFNPRSKRVFIFGVGGAGSTCALKLAGTADKIFVYDTDAAKTQILSKRFLKYFGSDKIRIIQNKRDIRSTLKQSHLLVNATGYGRKRNELIVRPEFLHKKIKIIDLIYNPQITPLMREAKKRKLKAVNGLGMLLYQGAVSFKIWTGKKAPIAVMQNAIEREMKK